MHRALRVGDYWNWLPTFRAVAETSSLRDAATKLHVAPSAISRTVRLLEESLGHALFERGAGTLVLNAAGRTLLEGVRAAMRLVDEAHGEKPETAPCHIHCPSDVVALLLDAITEWTTAHPAAPPLVHLPCAEDVAAQLLRGDLDVALAFAPAGEAGVASRLLGSVSSSIYCAPSHRASQLASVTDGELATLPFVDYPVGELSFLRPMVDPERQRVAYVPTMDLAASLASRGVGVVCVPDFVVERAGARLARLSRELPLASLHVWFRRPLGGADAPSPAIVEHLVASPVFASLVRAPAETSIKRKPGGTKSAKKAARS